MNNAQLKRFEQNKKKFFELNEMALGYDPQLEAERGDTSLQYFVENLTNADMLKESKYLLSTYFEWGHMNFELKDENPTEWRSEVAKLKRFIARLEKEQA